MIKEVKRIGPMKIKAINCLRIRKENENAFECSIINENDQIKEYVKVNSVSVLNNLKSIGLLPNTTFIFLDEKKETRCKIEEVDNDLLVMTCFGE